MPDQVRASHILLMYKGSMRSSNERSKEDARAKIAEIKKQLDGGVDFASLAHANSDCPSKDEGGDLGEFGKGMMVKEFETAAFALPIGGTTGVIETPFGYHIIRRTG